MRSSCKGLVDYISHRYGNCAEIGVGHFPDVAQALSKAGVRVFATDIRRFRHEGLEVVVDDITEPNKPLYAGVELIYSIRPPVELVPYMERLAKEIGAALVVKPLSSEHPGGRLSRRGETTFFLWCRS